MTNEGRILQAFSNCNSEAKLQILLVTTQLLTLDNGTNTLQETQKHFKWLLQIRTTIRRKKAFELMRRFYFFSTLFCSVWCNTLPHWLHIWTRTNLNGPSHKELFMLYKWRFIQMKFTPYIKEERGKDMGMEGRSL